MAVYKKIHNFTHLEINSRTYVCWSKLHVLGWAFSQNMVSSLETGANSSQIKTVLVI